MTAEGALNQGAGVNSTVDPAAGDDDETLHCYRHPQTETVLRCGRCDNPICQKCAVFGPVGARCRDCGRIAHDPLTSFTPRQLVLGTGVALAAGAVAGFISGYIGYFTIIIGYFAGRFVADAVTRVIGYKRGPVMLAILFSGIIVGSVIGFGSQYATLFGGLSADQATVALILQSFLPPVLISAGAACFGAYQRLH